MNDIEKVIKGLTICHDPLAKCEDCPYHDLPDEQICNDALCLDALELLKEQEAVKPVKQIEENEWTVCGHCRKHLISKWMFCPYCGKMVNWE